MRAVNDSCLQEGGGMGRERERGREGEREGGREGGREEGRERVSGWERDGVGW